MIQLQNLIFTKTKMKLIIVGIESHIKIYQFTKKLVHIFQPGNILYLREMNISVKIPCNRDHATILVF